MKLLIAKLACKVLTTNANFCRELSVFGTLGIPENDPMWKETKKEEFDRALYDKGIDPIVFWNKFDSFLQTNSCQQEYNFVYIPGVPAWEQRWD